MMTSSAFIFFLLHLFFATVSSFRSLKAPQLMARPPSPFARFASQQAKVASNPHKDLWIVGCGTLGSQLCQQASLRSVKCGSFYQETAVNNKKFGTILAETLSNTRHDFLSSLSPTILPRIRADRPKPSDEASASNVVICFPFSGLDREYYKREVEEAIRLYNGEGHLIFVSSGGVYAEKSGGVINESSPLNRDSLKNQM